MKHIVNGASYVLTVMVLVTAIAVVLGWEPSVEDDTVSVMDIVKNHVAHKDELVRAHGFCNIQFEGMHGLYSRDFRENEEEPLYVIPLRMAEGVNPFEQDGCRDTKGEYVVIEGRFRANSGETAWSRFPAIDYLEVERIVRKDTK